MNNYNNYYRNYIIYLMAYAELQPLKDRVAPELFAKSAHVYVRFAEADVARHQAFMATVKEEDLENYRFGL